MKISKQEHKKINNYRLRKKMIEICGEKSFLLPDQLKFPIIIPGDKKCKIDKRLLQAAYMRARQYQTKKPGYREIALKAKSLLRNL